MNRDLFWIEHEHDRTSASDGRSRYGVYVRQRIHGDGGFAECWDGTWDTRLTERFAALAWHTATSPVMAPPYVDWRSPVLSARLSIDAESGTSGLVATVDIAAPWPGGLRDSRGRIGGRSWYSWKRERSVGREYLRAPYEDDINRDGGCYALTTVQLMFPVPVDMLPPAPLSNLLRDEVEMTAREAVAAVTGELNRAVGPVVAALEARGDG